MAVDEDTVMVTITIPKSMLRQFSLLIKKEQDDIYRMLEYCVPKVKALRNEKLRRLENAKLTITRYL